MLSLKTSLKDYRAFRRMVRKGRRDFHQSSSFIQSLRTFRRWRCSINGQSDPLAAEIPWITFGAVDFLESILTPQMRAFEYGSGGSTLYFCRRVAEVFSVEHDPVWYKKVTATLVKGGFKNIHPCLAEPALDPLAATQTPSDPDGYVSEDPEHQGKTFRAYAASIDVHPDASFDVVLVDGRARPSCLKHALPKVKAGGFMVVDNAERAHYQSSFSLLATAQWQRQDFSGPGPLNHYFWQTSIWRRRP
jgi:hypothetical protein